VIILYAVINGYLDDIPVERVRAFEDDFLRFMATSYPDITQRIAKEKAISDEAEEALKKAIVEFKETLPKE